MADVSVKMGVSGISQFKQGMKESQQAVKTLEQALKLNEAQLKLNGNEELVLQNRTELLTKQIEAQKDVVRNAESALESMRENGVEQTSTAFQKMQQDLYKATTDLINMESNLDGVGEAGEEAQSGVSEMNQSLQRIGKNVSFDTVIDGIGKVTSGLEAAAEKAIQLGKKLIQAMLSGGQWADDLQTTADQWGVSPETAYRMQQTANLIDTSADTIVSAQDKVKKGREEQGKEFMGSLAYLGIDPNGKSDVDLFWEAGEAIQALGAEEDKVHYAQTLFGKSWRELLPLFKAGREEYDETMSSWTWVGDEQFQNLTKLNDAEATLTSEWEAFQRQFEAALAPAMTTVMETLQGLLKEFNTYLQSTEGQEMLENLGKAVAGLFTDLSNIEPEQVIAGLAGVFNQIKEGFQWIFEHKEDVINALKAIVTGWGVLKLTGGALQILQFINGIQGLTGAKAAAEAAGAAAGSSWASAFASAATTLLKAIPWLAGLLVLTDTSNHGSNDITMQDLTRQAYEGDEYATRLFNNLHDRYGLSIDEAANKSGLQEALAMVYVDIKELYANLENLYGWTPIESDETPKLYESGGQGPELGTEVIHKDRRTGEILPDDLQNSMDRMTEVAENTNTTNREASQSSADMTAAATAMLDLPQLIQTAVINGMASVSITIDASGIDAMQPRIAGGITDNLVQMVK